MSDTDNKQDTKQEQESKVLSFDKPKKAKKPTGGKRADASKPKQKITFGWILGMIILILIAISFIAGPAIQGIVGGRSSSALNFGKYGKESISYAYGNYFYDQVQSHADQYKGSTQDQTQLLYQIWKGAYDSTVIYNALNQLADKAGIVASDEAVNRAIINSGAYHKDGKFDVETYQKTSAEAKDRLEDQIRRSFPSQIVMDDVGSVLSSKAESEFIAAMAEHGRTFTYLPLGPNLYPDNLAAAYALENSQLFATLDLSLISMIDQDLASSVANQIILGTTSFEDAAIQNSLDSFATAGGMVGKLFYHGIADSFTNSDDALSLLSAKDGDILGPFESQGAWTIWKINSAAAQADFTDEATLAGIKAYMATNESALIDPWLDEFAQQIAEEAAQMGIEEVALNHDIDLIEVAATPYNVAHSTYMSDLSYTDPTGLLNQAATTADVAKSLYNSDEFTLLDPIKVGSNYLIVQTGTDEYDEGMGSYITMFYDYYSGSQNQQDLTQALYASDAHQNDFLATFFNVVLGQ